MLRLLSSARVREAAAGLAAVVALVGSSGDRPLDPVAVPAPGVAFLVKITLHYPVRLKQPDDVLLCHAQFANGRGRLDVDSIVGKTPFHVGDYMLMIDSSKTMLVRPKTKSAFEVESPLQNPLETLLNSLGPGVTVRQASVGFDSLGAGETIEGYATDHYRVFLDYTLDKKGVNGMTHPTTHQSSEMWVADLALPMASPFAGRVPGDLTVDDSSKDIHRGLSDLNARLGTGVALKRVVRTTLAIGNGGGMDYVQTVELSQIHQTEVDEGRFELPAGYAKHGGDR